MKRGGHIVLKDAFRGPHPAATTSSDIDPSSSGAGPPGNISPAADFASLVKTGEEHYKSAPFSVDPTASSSMGISESSSHGSSNAAAWPFGFSSSALAIPIGRLAGTATPAGNTALHHHKERDNADDDDELSSLRRLRRSLSIERRFEEQGQAERPKSLSPGNKHDGNQAGDPSSSSGHLPLPSSTLQDIHPRVSYTQSADAWAG